MSPVSEEEKCRSLTSKEGDKDINNEREVSPQMRTYFPILTSHLTIYLKFVLKINRPWEVTDFSATGARERRLIQKSKQPKGNLISTAEFYAVNG